MYKGKKVKHLLHPAFLLKLRGLASILVKKKGRVVVRATEEVSLTATHS